MYLYTSAQWMLTIKDLFADLFVQDSKAGSAECMCAAGKFLSLISSLCEDCPYRTYKPDLGNEACLACPGTPYSLHSPFNVLSSSLVSSNVDDTSQIRDPSHHSLHSLMIALQRARARTQEASNAVRSMFKMQQSLAVKGLQITQRAFQALLAPTRTGMGMNASLYVKTSLPQVSSLGSLRHATIRPMATVTTLLAFLHQSGAEIGIVLVSRESAEY